MYQKICFLKKFYKIKAIVLKPDFLKYFLFTLIIFTLREIITLIKNKFRMIFFELPLMKSHRCKKQNYFIYWQKIQQKNHPK